MALFERGISASAGMDSIVFSEAVGDNFRIRVSLPERFDAAKKYAAVYLMDSNLFFGMVNDTVRILEYGNEIPDTIIVGVGYPQGSDHLTLRNRDYCPTPYNMPEASGGAAQFLSFIDDELKPQIESLYSLDKDNCVLAGDSLSGLFALYILFNKPELFSGYIAGSPSLYWDEKIMFEYEKKYSEKHNDLEANVFMSVGKLEAILEPSFAGMVSNVLQLEKILLSRSYPSLKLTTHVFEDETHLSVIPATMSRGFRTVLNATIDFRLNSKNNAEYKENCEQLICDL